MQSKSRCSWITPDLSFSARCWEVELTNMSTEAHTHAHTHKCSAPAQEHTVWHRHTYTAAKPCLARHRQPSALASFQRQPSNKAEGPRRDCIPICQREDAFLMLNGLLKSEWPFFPPLRINVGFFRVCAMYLSHKTVSWQVMEPEWASNKTASRIHKY